MRSLRSRLLLELFLPLVVCDGFRSGCPHRIGGHQREGIHAFGAIYRQNSSSTHFSRETPEFEYLRAHYVHEPDHINNTRTCATKYLDVFAGHGELLREGAETYLDLYQKMFHELDTLIFK